MSEPVLSPDASAPSEHTLWERIRALVTENDAQALVALVRQLSEDDRIHAFGRLDAETSAATLEAFEPGEAASLLAQLPDTQATDILEVLSPGAAAAMLSALRSNVRAALLSRLSFERAEAILAEATPRTVAQTEPLLSYAADTAGSLMITEFVSVRAGATTESVIAELRANAERYATYVVQYVYVVGTSGELRGVLQLRDLLLAPSARPVGSIMLEDPVSIQADTSLEQLRELFEGHGFRAVPVIEEDGRLVGLLLREAVYEARADAAEAATLKARGIVGGDELRSMPVLLRSRRRLAWLSINIVLNMIAASVIAYYEDTLQAVIALAVFLPIISDMSGCSGNQAVAVSLRELTLGVTRPSDLARVIGKEAALGVINGLVLGLLLGGVALLWRGNVALGLVVGAALAVNTLVSVCIGGMVPLFIRRLGYDPALASGPMLTTVTDMCGFFLALSFATAALTQLQM